ncbi:MAG: methionine synthase, partial [Synergistota bacterium]|nr:methionine synthase [Synergistota bacterium]
MTKTYLPNKSECMPAKNILFARTGIRYGELLNSPRLLRRANELFLEGLKLIDPKICFDTFFRETLPKELIPASFEEAGRVTVFLSTLGRAIENRMNEHANRGGVFDAFILDSWASESLEALNRSFDRKLREKNGRGTMRFSP